MFTLSIFLIVVGFFLAIFIGINLSSNIKDVVFYFLFWLMYLITIITFGSFGVATYFYSIMREKKGPRGPRGLRGDRGQEGNSGNCKKSCGEDLCYNTVVNHIVDMLNIKEINNGGFELSQFKNVYLKSKIKSICSSSQFDEHSKIGGPANLIEYLKNVWGEITKLIYESGGGSDNGGIIYFKTVGAENSWNWIEENPFDEFKKYDIYYWGLSKKYLPKVVDKCLDSNKTSAYVDQPVKNQKYSVMSFLKVPNIDFNTRKDLINQPMYANTFDKRKTIKIYNAYTFTNDDDVSRKYINKKNTILGPDVLLVSKFKSKKTSLSYSGKGGVIYKLSDKFDKTQHFKYEYLNNNPEYFRLKHVYTGMYLFNDNKIRNVGSIYKFQSNN